MNPPKTKGNEHKTVKNPEKVKKENTFFLNADLQVCNETSATYVSTRDRVLLGGQTHERQELEAYTSELVCEAERISRERIPQPIGVARKITEKITLGGLTFAWEETHWEYEGVNHSIRINPATDMDDALACLDALKSIKTGVFTRSSMAKEDTIVIIGSTDKESENCVASAQRNKIGRQIYNFIRIPFCENGAHLIAVGLDKYFSEQNKPEHLQKIILHEIGHTLKFEFPDEREKLRTLTETKFEAIIPILKEVSPEYLGAQSEGIHLTLTAKQAVVGFLDGPTTKQKIEAENEADTYSQKIGAEIFAEMVRYYYLEPCITGKFPMPPNSDFETFDRFAKKLIESAKTALPKPKPKPLGKNPDDFDI